MSHHPRSGQRIEVELPVEVRWKSRSGTYRRVHGKTYNISGNGLFVTIPIRPRLKTPVTITVSLPSEITQVPVEILCKGRVVRWDQKGQQRGLGAIIDDYQLRRVKQ
jgi:hypothetical protein